MKATRKTQDTKTVEDFSAAPLPDIADRDDLHRELEKRYGCGFAQWLIDRMDGKKAA